MTMNSNGAFRDDELVLRRQKVNGEWLESYFPRVGGRLRLAHEQNDQLGIQTDVIRFDENLAVVKATVATTKGSFCGFGTASAQRDARLADSLLELAETRSIARALRFSGYGVEYTGAEEVSHVIPDQEPAPVRTENKGPRAVSEAAERQDIPETKPAVRPKPSENGSCKATQAQCRALYALTKKARYTDEDIESMLRPLNASTFQDLTRESASQLIGYLQTEVAA
jgi:hypothetical protein